MLKETLSANKIRISSLAKEYNTTRPTIYSWIDKYESGKSEEIPKAFKEFLSRFDTDENPVSTKKNILEILNVDTISFFDPPDLSFGITISILNKNYSRIIKYFKIKPDSNSPTYFINYMWLQNMSQYKKYLDDIKEYDKACLFILNIENNLKEYTDYHLSKNCEKFYNYLFLTNKKARCNARQFIEYIFAKQFLYINVIPKILVDFEWIIFDLLKQNNSDIFKYFKNCQNDLADFIFKGKYFTLDRCRDLYPLFKNCKEHFKPLPDIYKNNIIEFINIHSTFKSQESRQRLIEYGYAESLNDLAILFNVPFSPNGDTYEKFKYDYANSIEPIRLEVPDYLVSLIDKELKRLDTPAKSEEELFTKYMEITIQNDKESGELYDGVTNFKSESYWDYFVNVIGTKVDAYYTLSRTEFYSQQLCFENFLYSYIIKNQEVRKEFTNHLTRSSNTLAYCLNINNQSLTQEILGNIDMLRLVLTSEENSQLSYCACISSISLLEKLVRAYYTSQIKPDENGYNLTLSICLLTKNEKECEKHLGKKGFHFYKFLSYELLKNNDTGIGINLRNDLMHRRDLIFFECNSKLALTCFSLLMHTINFYIATLINNNRK